MKVAIASSGLGHVARGIETWTRDSAEALSQLSVISDRLSDKKLEVVLFSGAPLGAEDSGKKPEVRALSCFKRNNPIARWLARVMPGFTWRWGWKSAVGWEQYTFWRGLRRELRGGGFDILHTQEALLAKLCNGDAAKGYWNGKVILAHGTEETPEFLEHFKYVQHLTPWHQEQATRAMRDAGYEMQERHDFAIPNFVDTNVFCPSGLRSQVSGLRAELGVPSDAFVIGCVAAVKKVHKRIDYLIREFSSIRADPCSSVVPFLLVAGAKTEASTDLVELADRLAPGQVKFLFDLPREQMPDVYRAMDVFVLTSLFEMMPIAILEALASGVPCVVNEHPNLEWMAGDSGVSVDMSREGVLNDAVKAVLEEDPTERGRIARERAKAAFARETVIPQMRSMYEEVARA